jgi:hypothetical protein
MKVVAFVMICLFCLSGISWKAGSLSTSAKETCCHKMAKQSSHSHKQNNDCGGNGVCNMLLCGAGCGFLKVDPVTVNPVIPILKESPVTPYHIGDLSDYSLSNWNPPRV